MNKYKNTSQDIHQRIYKFVVNCFNNVVKKILKNTENIQIIQQVSSSLTSMGANDQEADGAATKKDFIAKYCIVRKETKETLFWLNLIKDTSLINPLIVNPYIQECQEILMIVSKIISNTKH
jgi:four helix bundle protein